MLKSRAKQPPNHHIKVRTKKKITPASQTHRTLSGQFYLGWLEIKTNPIITLASLGLGLLILISTLIRLPAIYQAYSSDIFEAGGIYREGVVGEVQVINPILAKTSTDRDLTHLIFSGLTKFGQTGKLEPDLAKSWEIDPTGLIYTFHLRDDVKWHDGHAFSARDVDFTLTAIQNPDTRSGLQADWQNVNHKVIDDNTLELTLPTRVNNFINQTTIGIIPSHLLESVEPNKLRFHSFNLAPVGTGAFRYLDYQDNKLITLEKNPDFYHGIPYLDQIQIQTFVSKGDLLLAYSQNQIDSFSGISLELDPNYLYKLRQNSYIGLFLNNSSEKLNSPEKRLSLEQLIDKPALLESIDLSNQAVPINYPVFSDQEGYNQSLGKHNYNPDQALARLREFGLEPNQTNYKLVTTSSLSTIAEAVSNQLLAFGIELDINIILSQQQLNDTIASRDYDILLFGQNTGSDSDVYSFWHSSQADFAGTNLANYKNTEADRLLESARLDSDAKSRAEKISDFLEIWQADTASIILYRPYYLIYSRIELDLPVYKIITPSNRFDFAYLWKIKTTSQSQVKP
ncbi:peptide ABC transporter substrate-binding protein [Candidatus Saccharibacteria bacterium]|nr:peptide ABC transporter substrate-binding protein [Candidatus Saccharibacteria bacterium]MCB9834941.1 peptide ABC transporter substrate-binding protein [Candidatus Nomurabacteria bacterium]